MPQIAQDVMAPVRQYTNFELSSFKNQKSKYLLNRCIFAKFVAHSRWQNLAHRSTICAQNLYLQSQYYKTAALLSFQVSI